MSLRIALYARVSTLHQAQAQTIDQQLTRLQAYATAHDWLVPDDHIFRDDGRSGATLNRPGLDHLRDAVRAGELDRVLVTEPDRLARNYVQQMIIMDELEHNGCPVEFLDRPLSDDPQDRLLLQIRGAVAEYERTLIGDRMRRGRQAKYRAGTLLPWTRAPYGYRLNPDRPRDPSGLTTDPAEAAVISQIFAWYAEGHTSLQQVARQLQAQCVPTPNGKQLWSLCTLHNILTQPAYTGQIYAERFTARPARIRRSATHPMGRPHDSLVATPRETWIPICTIPALVSQELFDRVQQKLVQNQRFARRNTRHDQYLLRALVSCGMCQSSCLARRLKSGHSYYVCAAKGNPIHTRKAEKCRSRFSPAQQLDDLVWQDVCDVLRHPDSIAYALERAHGGNWLPQELQARREQLRLAQQRLRQQIERLTEAYLGAVIPLPEYQRRRQDLEQKLAAFAIQEEQLTAQVDRQADLAALKLSMEAFCQRVQAGLDHATFAQKRELVELLIDRVIVADGAVEIRYVIPTSPSSEHVRFCHLRSDYFGDPDMVRCGCRHMPQQIGIDPMLRQAFTQIGAGRNPGNPHLAHIPLHPFPIGRPECLRQQHPQFARAIKGMRGIQLVNPVFHRHFLRRWRHRLIVQTGAAQPEQIGLGAQREGIHRLLHPPPPLALAHAGSFFFRKLTCVVKRPISAYRSSSWRS
jgi:site-specific DNA recombinase